MRKEGVTVFSAPDQFVYLLRNRQGLCLVRKVGSGTVCWGGFLGGGSRLLRSTCIGEVQETRNRRSTLSAELFRDYQLVRAQLHFLPNGKSAGSGLAELKTEDQADRAKQFFHVCLQAERMIVV